MGHINKWLGLLPDLIWCCYGNCPVDHYPFLGILHFWLLVSLSPGASFLLRPLRGLLHCLLCLCPPKYWYSLKNPFFLLFASHSAAYLLPGKYLLLLGPYSTYILTAPECSSPTQTFLEWHLQNVHLVTNISLKYHARANNILSALQTLTHLILLMT